MKHNLFFHEKFVKHYLRVLHIQPYVLALPCSRLGFWRLIALHPLKTSTLS